MSAAPRGNRTRLKHSMTGSPTITVQGALSPSSILPSPSSMLPAMQIQHTAVGETSEPSPQPPRIPGQVPYCATMPYSTEEAELLMSIGMRSPTAAAILPTPRDPTTNLSDNDSSILSELEEGPDYNDEIVSASSERESSPGIDSEAETERLEISPEKLRNARSPTSRGSGLKTMTSSGMADTIMSNGTTGQVAIPAMDTVQSEREEVQDANDESDTGMVASPSNMASHKRKRTSSLSEEAEDFTKVAKRSTSIRREVLPTASQKFSIFGNALQLEDDDGSDALSEVSSPDEEIPISTLPDIYPGDEEEDASDEEVGIVAVEQEKGVDVSKPEDEPVAGETAELDLEEDDAEIAPKSEDELAKKKSALDALAPIEKLFAIFRDQLFDEKLAALSAELESLNNPNCTHSGFVAQQQILNARRDEKIQLEVKTLAYKKASLDTVALANRSLDHSQYYQSVREIRERHLDAVNARFTKTQRERRQRQSKEPKFGYKFNPQRSTQVANQAAYNKEVSLLSGIARHRGFPAAPELPGARPAEVDDDFSAMQIKAPASRPRSMAALIATSRADEAAAEEQFLEKNPWANPNHPAHHQALMIERSQSNPAIIRRPISSVTPANQRWAADSHQTYGPASSTSTIPGLPSDPLSGPPAPASHRARNGASSPFDQTIRRDPDTFVSAPAPSSRFERPYKPKNMPPSTITAASSFDNSSPAPPNLLLTQPTAHSQDFTREEGVRLGSPPGVMGAARIAAAR